MRRLLIKSGSIVYSMYVSSFRSCFAIQCMKAAVAQLWAKNACMEPKVLCLFLHCDCCLCADAESGNMQRQVSELLMADRVSMHDEQSWLLPGLVNLAQKVTSVTLSALRFDFLLL